MYGKGGNEKTGGRGMNKSQRLAFKYYKSYSALCVCEDESKGYSKRDLELLRKDRDILFREYKQHDPDNSFDVYRAEGRYRGTEKSENDTCEISEGTTVFYWTLDKVGFGQLVFYKGEDGKIHCDNECMSKGMVKRILNNFVDDCIFDDDKY